MDNRRVPVIRRDMPRSGITPRKTLAVEKRDLQEFIDLKIATCSICLDVLHYPVVLICRNKCLQNACKECAEKITKCMVCNAEVVMLPVGLSICNAIDNLPRNCDACKQIILPNKHNDAHTCLKYHSMTCPEVIIDCRFCIYGCLQRIKRSDQVKHEQYNCRHVPCENNKGVVLDRCMGCTFVGSCEEHTVHKCTMDKKLIEDIGLLKLRLDSLIPGKDMISDVHFYVTDEMKGNLEKLMGNKT